MLTAQEIIKSFKNEELISEAILPAVDPRQAQNTMANPNAVQKSAPMIPQVNTQQSQSQMNSVPSVLDRPPVEEPSKPNPSQPGEMPTDENPNPEEVSPEEKPESVELGAASSGLALAEYHLRKLSELSAVQESELSSDNEKILAAYKVIQDTRKAIDECAKRKKESKGVQTEDVNLIGAAILGIGGEEKLINVVMSPDDDNKLMLMTDLELQAVRSARLGRSSAPYFLKLKGKYHPVIKSSKITDSKVYKGSVTFDATKALSEKEAEQIINSFEELK